MHDECFHGEAGHRDGGLPDQLEPPQTGGGSSFKWTLSERGPCRRGMLLPFMKGSAIKENKELLLVKMLAGMPPDVITDNQCTRYFHFLVPAFLKVFCNVGFFKKVIYSHYSRELSAFIFTAPIHSTILFNRKTYSNQHK